MQRGRFYYLMSLGSGFILLVALFLLMQESFLPGHATHPWLFAGRIVVVLVLFFCGILGFVKVNEGASLADRSSRDFDAREALQQVRAGNIPADWVVFRASFKKLLSKTIALIVALFVMASLLALCSLSIAPLFSLIAMFLFLCASSLSFVWRWQARKDTVLVVTPEGFIHGNSRRSEKALRLKYRDIADIHIIGETVAVQARDNWGRQLVDCTLFESPTRDVANTLFTAFSRFDSTGVLAEAPSPTVPMLDARELFQQVRAGNISADWTVFRPAGQKMIVRSLVVGLVISALFVYYWSLFFFGNSPFYTAILLFIMSACSLLFSYFLFWWRLKNTILIVMPEGFVCGKEKRPEKALCLPYRDIAEMKTVGEIVKLRHKDQRKWKSVNCSVLFSASKSGATALFTAFSRYKAHYPESLMTITPYIASSNQPEGDRD